MKYFGHQCDASQDIRLKKLRKTEGSVGVDIYWRCLEMVGNKLTPKNTSCRLEYDFDEVASEVNTTPEVVEKALNRMADIGMCHKVPQDAIMCHYLFPKIIKYADKTFRNAYPGDQLDALYARMCPTVPLIKSKEVKFNLKEFKELDSKGVESKPAQDSDNGNGSSLGVSLDKIVEHFTPNDETPKQKRKRLQKQIEQMKGKS